MTESYVIYIAEVFSETPLGPDDGYRDHVPAGWREVMTYAEDGINLVAFTEMVKCKKGQWRLVKQTTIREVVAS